MRSFLFILSTETINTNVLVIIFITFRRKKSKLYFKFAGNWFQRSGFVSLKPRWKPSSHSDIILKNVLYTSGNEASSNTLVICTKLSFCLQPKDIRNDKRLETETIHYHLFHKCEGVSSKDSEAQVYLKKKNKVLSFKPKNIK